MIQLIRANVELLDAAIAGDRALEKALGHDVVPGWATFTEALPPTRNALAEDGSDARWGTRLFVAGKPPELVGWGGLKGPPTEGHVEIPRAREDRLPARRQDDRG